MYNPQLETFIEAAESGSFNKAAEKLFISPPAVIKQVTLLEKRLGFTLFIRTKRGLILTESGKSIYKAAKYIIQYCKDSVIRAKRADSSEANVIKIGTSTLTPANKLINSWNDLQALCPEIRFKLVPFINSRENAMEILKNLGSNIDVVAGIFDKTMLELWQCNGLELYKTQIRLAVSLKHKLSNKKVLSLEDLQNESIMFMHTGWSNYVDEMRNDLLLKYPKINTVDIDFYSIDVFNQCEIGNSLLMAIDEWKDVHPLLKIIPVKWDYSIPFGILHSPEPSNIVYRFLKAVEKIIK